MFGCESVPGHRFNPFPFNIYTGPDGRLYIFRGDLAYRFNSNGVGIENGYPRPISEVFQNGPSWIGAAVSDGRTGKFYIFKGISSPDVRNRFPGFPTRSDTN